MRLYLKLLLACWLCIFFGASCLAHGPLPFKYIGNAPNAYQPLKVIPVYIDKSFGVQDQLAIDDAIMQWNFALNGYVVLKVVSTSFDMEPEVIRQCLNGDCWMLMRIDSTSTFIPDDPKKPESQTLAWANEVGGNRIYFVRDRIINEQMTGVALHEMGHLLGAQHDDVYLMTPQFHWQDARCVDYNAVMLVAKYWGIPLNAVKYCIYG